MTIDAPKTQPFDPSHFATSGDIANLARLMKAVQDAPKPKSSSNIGWAAKTNQSLFFMEEECNNEYKSNPI